MQYDLFISYARKDNLPSPEGRPGYITTFIEGLKREHRCFSAETLRIFFDKDDIRDGDDWELKIDAALRGSALLIACLSPNYFNSAWCRKEWEAYSMHEAERAVAGEGVNPVYFIEMPGFEIGNVEEKITGWVQDLNKRNHTDLRSWIPFGLEVLEREEVRRRLELLDSQIVSRLDRINRAIEAPGSVDRPAQVFVGRQKEIHKLRHILSGKGTVGVITAVQGLGGIGKTALANQYAHAFAGEYPGGRWLVRCEGVEDLPTAMLQLVTPLDIELKEAEKKDSLLAMKRIVLELQERTLKHKSEKLPNPAALLIFDNVDKPAVISPVQSALLPKAEWLHIVATSRLSPDQLFEKHKDRQFLSLDELDETDGLQLIKRYQPDETFSSIEEENTALQIVRRLGGFTLAVESVAVYLGLHADLSCSGFLARLEAEGIDAQDTIAREDDVSGYIQHREKSLNVVLSPLLESLSKEERYVVELAVLLPPDSIPLPWLKTLVEKEFPVLTETMHGYPNRWEQIVRRLLGRKLLQATNDLDDFGKPRIVKMHRLLGEFVKNKIVNTELLRKDLFELELSRSEYLEENWYKKTEQWEIMPILYSLEYYLKILFLRAPQLIISASKYLVEYISIPKFEQLVKSALDLLGQDEKNEYADIAELSSLLGFAITMQDAPGQAQIYFKKALEMDLRYRSTNHQIIALRYSNLAALEQVLGDNATAKKYILQAISIIEQVYEPSHPELARAYIILASAEKSLGNFTSAGDYMIKAMLIDEWVYEPTHPVLARDYSEFAKLVQDIGNLSGAKEYLLKAIKIQEQVYEPTNPNLAFAYSNLASVERDLGNLAVAKEYALKAIEIYKQALGPSHSVLADDLINLGLIEQALGNLDTAEDLFRRSLMIMENIYGEKHISTANGLVSLGRFLADTQKYDGAENCARKSMQIWLDSAHQNDWWFGEAHWVLGLVEVN